MDGCRSVEDAISNTTDDQIHRPDHATIEFAPFISLHSLRRLIHCGISLLRIRWLSQIGWEWSHCYHSGGAVCALLKDIFVPIAPVSSRGYFPNSDIQMLAVRSAIVKITLSREDTTLRRPPPT